MYEKVLIFKIHGKEVEIVDWDITIDEIELLKQNVAFVHCVEASEIEVDTKEIYKPELSDTVFVNSSGLQYKAPNQYSVCRRIEGLTFSSEIETKRLHNGIDAITEDGLNNLMDKIISGRADDVIIFS